MTDPAEALERWRRSLARGGRRIAKFDPLDGGAAARVLILLETPGPGPDGPRLVSRDNPTGTARNLARFLADAGLARSDTILWNVVPWIVHAPGARNRALRRGEIREGIALLPPFLARLPRLEAALLAGRVAGMAADAVARARPDVHMTTMPHPSPAFVCTSPDVPRRIAAALADVAARIRRG